MAKNATATNPLNVVKLEPPESAQKPPKIGSARGLESMFRNAYRAQLDMIALAATKANIMISLNGFLVSLLLLSGAYLLESEPALMIPVGTFLLTCTVSIVFAVLAARPQIDRTVRKVDDFRTDSADLLLFRQFAKLPKHDFLSAMTEMMQSKDRIYKNMTVQIFDMGCTADRMFSRLHVSYSAFMIGLLISVGLLAAIVINRALLGA